MFKSSLSPLSLARVVMAIMLVMAIFATAAYAEPAAPTSGEASVPEQCANGGNGESPYCIGSSPIGWINANVNSGKGNYAEDQFVPARLFIDGLVSGYRYCFGFGYDISQDNPGRPAVDYVGQYNFTLPNANPAAYTVHDPSPVAGVVPAPDSSWPIPVDPGLSTQRVGTIDGNSFTGPDPVPGNLYMWGGTITSVGFDDGEPYSNPNSLSGATGIPYDSGAVGEQQSTEFCFTASSTEAVLAVGLHLSKLSYWNAPAYPSGSPFHISNGTRGGKYSHGRTSETDLYCLDCDGGAGTHVNIGRKEAQLSVDAVTVPAAVTLADFSATCSGSTPVITWETVSELTNQGFNLYRGVDSANPDTQLNSTLIPSQGPGSAQGFMYTWTDTTAQPETEYFYWLEDVDFNGGTNMHGPISVMCSAPTAVTLSDLNADSPTVSTLSGWMIALALAALLVGLIAVRRMRTN
ncbi:MAG: hypothetical protein H6649_00365 [Caldilineae bacterium]|nr:hypothetical protein [Anaerolineae bacterium]MCB0204382.1 hypothetical protein [Anaerolineae bacterium]MCB9152495.1 hypothetical protein [Caldilineae bacterium]